MQKFIPFLILSLFSFSLLANEQNIEIHQRGDQFLSYNFGLVMNNTKTNIYYSLKNTSQSDINIKAITISGPHYFASSDCPQILKPSKRCVTTISYWPVVIGAHHGQVNWETNQGDVHLSLWGESYE